MTHPTGADWWRSAVVYQIYPRSFADDDRDGTGDVLGIIDKLPYLAELGVDAIWVSPWYPSPLADGGYDVTDYRDIHPDFGTLEQADEFVRQAHELGMRVLIDLVPNHSSDQHPWFQAALAAAPGSPERELYIFRDGLGRTATCRPTTGRQCSVAVPGSALATPTGRPGSGTCTFSPLSSPTGTGRTRRLSPSSRRSSASGSTVGSTVSASMSRTRWRRT